MINNCRQREERQEKNMEINRPYTVVQYSKFRKGVHIRIEVKLETFVNSAFHFTKVLALRNSIQLVTTRLSAVSEVSGQVHKLQCQNVSKNILWG
jgi:hypothetical protein